MPFLRLAIPYIKYIPWAISGLMLVVALFYRGQYIHEQALRMEDIAKAQQAVLEQKAKEEALSREINDRHSQELARLKEAYSGRIVSILKSQNSNVCVGSPPVDAFLDGLRRDSKAGSVQDKATK